MSSKHYSQATPTNPLGNLTFLPVFCKLNGQVEPFGLISLTGFSDLDKMWPSVFAHFHSYNLSETFKHLDPSANHYQSSVKALERNLPK